MPRPHRAAVRRDPLIQRTELVELGAVAAPVDEGIESEAREDLRELRGMPERIGDIRDARNRSELADDRSSREQVANVRLSARQQ